MICIIWICYLHYRKKIVCVNNQSPLIYIKSLDRNVLVTKYTCAESFEFETANCVKYNFQYFYSQDPRFIGV